MRRTTQKNSTGSIVIYLIAVLAVLGVLSMATTGFFSSSTLGTATTNCPVVAQYLAEAGVRYALSEVRAQASLADLTTAATTLTATTYTVTDAGTFDMTVGAPVDNGTGFYTVSVSCTGTACLTDGGVTNTSPAITVTTNVPAGGAGGEEGEISFDPGNGDGGVGNFEGSGEGGQSPGNSVQTNPDEHTVDLGNNTRGSYGCAWYKGNESSCTQGVCTFGAGFRTYFEAQFSSNAQADGFVFAIINAINNTVNDCGGDSDRGELLGYAGKGLSGRGLKAPKIGLEFDIYQNSGTGSVCSVGQRNDDSESRDHVAWLFWGHDYWSGGCDGTYDDNRHGAGTHSGSDGTPPNSSTPTNPENIGETGEGDDGYYYDESNGGDWLRKYNQNNNDKRFRIRIEVDRALTANADGNYCYTLKGWIVRDSVDMPDGYGNVNTDFYDSANENTLPQVVHTMVISAAHHAKFEKIIFGWTVGTGGASQIVSLSNFQLTFKHNETSCSASSKPTDYVTAVPMYEGFGGTLHNIAPGGTTSWVTNAYWLKGTSCPECSSLYFDDTYGPAPFWDNTAALTTKGTVSVWVYLKDYNDYMGIVHKGNAWDFSDEAFSLQFTEENYQASTNDVRYNDVDTCGGGGGHGGGHGGHGGFGGGGGGGGGNYPCIADGHKEPILCINDGGAIQYCVTSNYQLELNKWYHLTATWDSPANEMKFFVNGSNTATFDTTDDGWNLPAAQARWSEFIIGAQNTSGHLPFNGMIDDVYLYDRVLTDEEIVALYNDGHLTPQE